MERNVLKERLMNKDDKNRHFVLLIIDISKHGAKEMGHVLEYEKEVKLLGVNIDFMLDFNIHITNTFFFVCVEKQLDN
jgi:diaminopimelate epimerase